MTFPLNRPGHAGKRLEAVQPSNCGPADRGNLLLFPTGQRLEAFMLEQGDDAGHCSNALSAENYREATPEDRATFRKWVFGTVIFYCTLLLISRAVAVVAGSNPRSTRLPTPSDRPTPAHH